MEQRLIDANAAITFVSAGHLRNPMEKTWSDNDVVDMIESRPTVDAVQVVRCKECKHRILNDHYGKKGYFNLKAMCDLDTGDIFELGRNAEIDDWFCADGERRTDETEGS